MFNFFELFSIFSLSFFAIVLWSKLKVYENKKNILKTFSINVCHFLKVITFFYWIPNQQHSTRFWKLQKSTILLHPTMGALCLILQWVTIVFFSPVSHIVVPPYLHINVCTHTPAAILLNPFTTPPPPSSTLLHTPATSIWVGKTNKSGSGAVFAPVKIFPV